MTEPQWIVIPNWRKFQHYKDRTPRWIKNYTELLADPNYLKLNGRHRGILHGIWLLYAASNEQLAASPAMLNHLLGFPTEWEARAGREGGERVVSEWRERGEAPIRKRDITRLEKAGFIQLLLAPVVSSASPEVEVEKEKKDLALKGPTSNGNGTHTEHRPYDPPIDPVATIRRLIGRTIHDHVDLETELRAHTLTDDQAHELRAFLPNPQPRQALDEASAWITANGFMHDDPLAEAIARWPTLELADISALEAIARELTTAPEGHT